MATMRAIWSVPPRTGNEQINLIDRVGCQSSALPGVGTTPMRPSMATAETAQVKLRRMVRSLVLCFAAASHHGGDGVAHFRRAGLAAKISGQMLAFGDHLRHRLLHPLSSGAGP